VRAARREFRDAVDHVADEMIAIEIVEHHHVEGRRRCALLLIAAHVQVAVIGAAVRQAVDQPRVAVVRENHRLVLREEAVEVAVLKPVRMLALGLQRHQVDDIDHADFDSRKKFAQQLNSRERFERRDVAGAGHHHVRFAALIVAGPLPNTEARRAMSAGGVHVEPLAARAVFPQRSR